MSRIEHEGKYCPACTANSVFPGLSKCEKYQMSGECEKCGEHALECDCEKYYAARKIARKVFYDIKRLVDNYQAYNFHIVDCHWSQCIQVDEYKFHEGDL